MDTSDDLPLWGVGQAVVLGMAKLWWGCQLASSVLPWFCPMTLRVPLCSLCLSREVNFQGSSCLISSKQHGAFRSWKLLIQIFDFFELEANFFLSWLP